MKKDIEWLKETLEERIDTMAKFEDVSYSIGLKEAYQHTLLLINQLDEPETLSEEWIDEHEYIRMDPDNPFVYVKDLQNLLVPKQDSKELDYQISKKVDKAYKDGYEKGKEHATRIEKPTIPQFVANHYEDLNWYHQDEFNNIPHVLKIAFGSRENTLANEILDWIEENPVEYMKLVESIKSRVGYEVEEEPKYRLKLNGDYLSRAQIDYGAEKGKPIEVTIRADVKGFPYNFSEDEKSYVEKYLNVEVEELEE